MTIQQQTELDPQAIAWLKQRMDARELKLTRLVVRREAWQADVLTHAGGRERYFLRIDRDARAGKPGRRGLKRETGLIRFLQEQTSIPCQHIVDWSDEHCIAIQSFEPGSAALHTEPREVRQRVLGQFVDILADMHSIDTRSLEIPEFRYPATPEEHSLLELAAVDTATDLIGPPDSSTLLGVFGKRWLHQHVPTRVERTCLLQGDTGAGNFMFTDSGVSAIVDWEWAHFGDPLEDLGNVWLRDFFTPTADGDLTPYFRRYAERAGLTLDRDKIIYYLIHQLVRSVISLPRLTRSPDPQSTVALNLGYQAVCDLLMCQALGLYHQIEAEIEPLGSAVACPQSEIYEVLAQQLEHGLAPKLDDAYTASMAEGGARIIRYLERTQTLGPQAQALELEGLNRLLGNHCSSLSAARQELLRELQQEHDLATERAIIEHCWGVASRNLELMDPLVEQWRQCRLATVAL